MNVLKKFHMSPNSTRVGQRRSWLCFPRMAWQLLEKTTATCGGNHGNQNPHLIKQIWKPGNGRCVIIGSQSSGQGSGWTLHRIIKVMIIIKTEQAGHTFRGNSVKIAILGTNFGILVWLKICDLAKLTHPRTCLVVIGGVSIWCI